MLSITKWLHLFTFINACLCKNEKVLQQYLSIEHVILTFQDAKYLEVKAWTQRYSRNDYTYYLNVEATTRDWAGNNFTFDIYFYEFLSNRYKPSFIELHIKLCDIIQKSSFLADSIRQGKLWGPCPYPPDFYPVYNITVMPPSSIPKGFPFTKGRIYLNVTYNTEDKCIFSGHADIELKNIRKKS